MICTTESALPYGVHDLDPQVQCLGMLPKRVRCYVRGCKQILRVPTRGDKGDMCPDHGIRCHYSSAAGTYTYADPSRNAIASPDLLAARIIRHPFKYESHRLGSERSEDMLSWNVFRSLQEAGSLGMIARLITGDSCPVEPTLYLWGICLTDDEFKPSEMLIAARERFESNLPVDRPKTEPDIMLHLPGRYLILIEAKFTSANTWYEKGPRKDDKSLTLDELLAIYHDPAIRILDHQRARLASRIHYQLWRNMIFAEWMAKSDHPKTKAYHVNLVRAGYERATAEEFSRLLRPEHKDRFRRLTWEDIYRLCLKQPHLGRLCRYIETKTAGLLPAFHLR